MTTRMKKVVNFFLVLIFISFPLGSFSASEREMREVTKAEHAIFWSLVASASPANRSACSENQFACSDDRADLGFSLLGAMSSSLAIKALAALLRYRIDGGISEDFTCYILMKKNAARKELLRINTEAMREECDHEFAYHSAKQPEVFKDVEVTTICASKTDIDVKRQALISQLTENKRCISGDFGHHVAG